MTATRKRIAAVIHGPFAYGVESRVSRVLEMLQDRYDITLAHIIHGGSNVSMRSCNSINHLEFNAVEPGQNFYLRTREMADRIGPVDLLWLNGDPDGGRIAWHLRRRGTRLVSTVCGDYHYYYDTALSLSSLVDCHTGMTAGICRKLGACLPEGSAVRHIPTGVSLPARTAAKRADRLLYAGRIEKAKGMADLLPFLEAAVSRGLDFRFQLAGIGTDRDVLMALAKKKGLAAMLVMPGLLGQNELQSLYAESGVYISFSQTEGMSNSLLEAMSHGLVPLVMPASGIEELICDGENGFVLPPGNVVEMVDRLALLQNDEELFLRLGRAARATIERSYSLESSANVYKALFQELLDLGPYKGRVPMSAFLGSRLDRPFIPDALTGFVRGMRHRLAAW